MTLEAIERAAGIALRTDEMILAVGGADALAYLHRMLTQDLRGLARGRGARAALLDRQGRTLGDLLIWHRESGLFLTGAPGSEEAARPVLERFVIADDVTFDDRRAAEARLVLAGPRAADVLRRLGGEAPAPGRLAEIEGIAWQAVRCGDATVFEGLGARDAVASLLAAAREGRWAEVVGDAAFEAFRVRHGAPRLGAELGAERLFNEAGPPEDAISWTKGCYPGQEPVVMARHRGRPPHRMVRFSIDGGSVAPGDALHDGERAVGVLTSVATVGPGVTYALGFVRSSEPDDGRGYRLPDGARARTLDSSERSES